MTSIPIHVFAALEPPKAILDALERLFSAFLWGSEDGARRRVWRSWDRLSRPYCENCLGVRNLHTMVASFSCKLWWKLHSATGFWAHLVNGISLRRSVSARRVLAVDAFMRANTVLLVGTGSCSFWHANWSDCGALVDLFPGVQANSDLQLRDCFHEGRWQLHLIPPLLHDFILQFEVSFADRSDRLVWKPSQSGSFTISSAYDSLRSPHSVLSDWNFVWVKRVPTKVSFFFWRLWNELLPFPESLRLLGYQLASKCPHCDAEDSIIHCFVHCPLAQHCWFWLEELLSFQVAFHDLRSVFHSFWHSYSGAAKDLVRLLPILVCWVLWKLRNLAIFEHHCVTNPLARRLLQDLLSSISYRHPFKHFGVAASIFNRFPFVFHIQVRRSSFLVHWSLPPFPLFKVNGEGESERAKLKQVRILMKT